MQKLKRASGKWVVGDDFWGREADVKLFVELLDEGTHIQLIAQRRMGKTSLMKEVARRLELEGRYLCLYVDLQKRTDCEDAVVALSVATRPHAKLWRNVGEVFRNTLGKAVEAVDSIGADVLTIKLRDDLTAGSWKAKGDRVFAALAASELPVVLFLDEMPILVNRLLKGDDYTITPERRRTADEFLSWLRDNRQRHQGQVRTVVSGSIGLEPILGQAGLSGTMMDLYAFKLQPWDDDTAAGCLEALANEYGIQFKEGACNEMVRLLGCCIPHHVQMFFDNVYEHCVRREDMTCSLEDAATVYRERMLSARGIAELNHYEERLRMVLGSELSSFAVELLSEAAVTGRLSPEACEILRNEYELVELDPSSVQRQILEILVHDGYLTATPKGYVFVSKLLRDWWKGRFEFFYTPARKRGRES